MDSIENQATTSAGSNEAAAALSKEVENSMTTSTKCNEDEFYEARDSLDDSSSSSSNDNDTFYDVSRIEALAELVTTEAVASLNEEINGFQSFIQQRRSEIEAELRSIANRDISTNRNRLENLFNRNNGQSTSEHIENNDTSDHRSPTIRSEIEELSQMSRVSRVLSTSGSQIESTLRNMIQQRRNRNESSQQERTIPEQIAQPAGATTTAQANEQVANVRNVSIDEITREQIVSEISTLVHQQLVSNTLRSEFRSTLERRFMNRMRTLGIENGEQTRQLVQNLGRESRRIQRNDFSNLGLAGAQQATPPITLSSAAATSNSREIRDMRNQIDELKQLVKLSFDLQLEMQRSLKQEISALVAHTWSQSASSQLVSSTRAAAEGSCVICTERSVDSVLYECGHMCACYVCAKTLKEKELNCPVCRAPIKDIIRAYRVGLD